MDAVCVRKRWELIAGMPCLVRERVGMRFVVMPQQTQIGGYFVPVKSQKSTRSDRPEERKVHGVADRPERSAGKKGQRLDQRL